MNVYYTGFKVVAAENRDGMDKKRTFPLLYNVEEKYFAKFEVIIDENLNIKKRDMVIKKGWIGYKNANPVEGEDKDLLFVNSDGSWGCETIKKFSNNIDFNDNKILLTGTLWLENMDVEIEPVFKEKVNEMISEAQSFLDSKIIIYENYKNILDRCPRF